MTTARPVTAPPVDGTCAGMAREHGAQLAGTAPVATGWLLVEQPGAWGRKALHESALDPAIGATLDQAATASGVRVQLIRRPGRQGASSTPLAERTVVFAHTGPTPWAEVLHLTDDRDLASLDPALALAERAPRIGLAAERPLWLVCTHGRRDRCCATLGRPIVDALTAVHGDAVWESSHVGGHRFAGNLVALPTGHVHGGLDVADALRVVDLHRGGRVDTATLRGRSGLSRPAQAAEVLVRERLGIDHLDAVADVEVTDDGEGRFTATLTVAGQRHHATLTHRPTGVLALPSCDADAGEDPGRYALVDLTTS